MSKTATHPTAAQAKQFYARMFANHIDTLRKDTAAKAAALYKEAASHAPTEIERAATKLLELPAGHLNVRLPKRYSSKEYSDDDRADPDNYQININGITLNLDDEVSDLMTKMKCETIKLRDAAASLALESSRLCKFNDNASAQKFAVDLFLRRGGNQSEEQIVKAIPEYLQRMGCTC